MTRFRPKLWTAAGAALLLAACSGEADKAEAPAASAAPTAAVGEGRLGPGLAAALIAAFAAFADWSGRRRGRGGRRLGPVGLARAGGEQEGRAGGGPEFRAKSGHASLTGTGRRS